MLIKNLVMTIEDNIVNAANGKPVKKIWPGAFSAVNNLMGGGYPEGVICVISPPGAGKTTYCINEALSMAGLKIPAGETLRQPEKVLYVSTEKSEEYIAAWFILALSKAEMTVGELLEGRLPTGSADRIGDAMTDLELSKIEVTDKVRTTAELREEIEKSGAKVIVIDSLQDLRPANATGDLIQDAARAITEIKDIQIQSHTIIIVVSHVNSAAMKNKKLDLTSPAYSSRISYYSDIILQIEQDRQTEAEKEKGVQFLTVSVLKSKEADTAGEIPTAKIAKKSNTRYLTDIILDNDITNEFLTTQAQNRATEKAQKEECRKLKNYILDTRAALEEGW